MFDDVSVSTLLHGAAVYSVSHGISNKGDSSTYDWTTIMLGRFYYMVFTCFPTVLLDLSRDLK